MYTRRRLSNRLTVLALLAAAGCVSDRYVGSIGHDLTYSNRGYGLTVLLKTADLEPRWTLIDPKAVDVTVIVSEPRVYDEPLDLNGDGELEMGETTRFLRPTLLLLSRTSTGAKLSVDVAILPAKTRRLSPDDLLRAELVKLAGMVRPLETSSISASRLTGEFEVRTAEMRLPARAARMSLIDQPDFLGEGGVKRRQIVRVVLSARALTPELREDHTRLLSAVLLARRGAPEGAQERW